MHTIATPQLLRTLSLEPDQHPRGQPYLSAASGLVQVKNQCYVLADDEHHLGCFAAPEGDGPWPDQPVQLMRLIEGDLPKKPKARKALKPDFEALAVLPAHAGFPYGALLALGSGSKSNREAAVLLPLKADGSWSERRAVLDLQDWYEPLHQLVTQLNIEGVMVAGNRLYLMQRGNKRDARSVLWGFDWADTAQWLIGRQPKPPVLASKALIKLGHEGDVPLSLTDGAALPNGCWAYCAVAESTSEASEDGACAASAVGIATLEGQVLTEVRLAGAPKVEGLTARVVGDQVVLTLVTDADNPEIASQLLSVTIPMPTGGITKKPNP
jgi:hypothetical protein